MRLAALLLLGGCTALFGLSHVDPPPPDTSVDAALRTVHCDYLWHVIPRAGMTVEMAAPADYAHVSVGGQELAIGGDGTFSFQTAMGQPWQLMFRSPTDLDYVDRDSDTCHLVTTFFHRLGAAVPTLSTPVSITLTSSPPVGGVVRFAGTGIRAYVQPAGPPPMSSTYTTDWVTVNDLAGEPAALLDAAAGDRLYWTHYAMTPDHYSLDLAGVTAVTLANGQTTAASVTPAPVAPRCTHVVTNAGMLISTLAASDPRGAGTPQAEWALNSSAMSSEGFNEGIPLAFTTGSNITDQDLVVPYGNPFTGETDMLAIGDSNIHSLAIGTATPIQIASAYNVFIVPQPDTTGACNSTTVVPVPPVALATTTTVAGQSLDADEQPVTIDRSAPVPVTIGLSSGPWDELIVAFYEVAAQNGATALVGMAIYQPLDTSFSIDPSLLLVGHEYALVVYARSGQPLARTQADFRTYAYPVAQSASVPFSFRIAN